MMQVEILPLRKRKEDIEILVEHFARKFAEDNGIQKMFLMKTLRSLEDYDWPGNVGELAGYFNKLVAVSPTDTNGPSLLDRRFRGDLDVQKSQPSGMTLSELDPRQEQERKSYIANTLRTCRTKRHAADRLGIGESRLPFLVNQLKIEA